MKIRIEEEFNSIGYFLNLYADDKFVKTFGYDPKSKFSSKFKAYREIIRYIQILNFQTHYKKTIKEYAI